MLNLRKFAPVKLGVSQLTTKLFSTLPSNLQLADLKIFDPVPQPKMNEEHYYFPIVNVPTHIDVLKFGLTVELSEPTPLVKTVFEVPIRRDIINDVVRYIRHKRRQPKKTKNMSEIRGSNKKPYPQKRSGRSQIGHKRNSSVVGGSKAHGPRLRDYRISLNKKVRALGTMMTLAAKYREGNLIIFDKLECETHKTRALVEILTVHGLHDRHTMYIDDGLNKNFVIASNNLKHAFVTELRDMTIYEILKNEKLVLTRRAFENIQADAMRMYVRPLGRKFINESRSVLEQAVAFCEDETNGYYETPAINYHDVHEDDDEDAEEDDDNNESVVVKN